jgi:AcrR family transcriptional regulator
VRNRSALIAAARELFGRRGLNVPLDDIAKQAGVSNATLYRHFPGRGALLAEVVVSSLHRHDVALAVALDQPSGWDGLVSFLEFLFGEQVAEVEHLGALRAIPAGENADVDRLRTHTLEGFIELIRRAKDEGSFRADRYAEDLYLMLFVNEQLAHLGETPQRAASGRLLELTLAAVTTRADPVIDAAPVPDEIMTLRHTLGHDLAGLPRLA